MSGHNKWSKIKHKKALTDSQKSKVFSKLVKLIQMESKRAGGNTDDPSLRATIEKAKKENMPKDNIDRAIKKGAGGDSLNIEPIMYETYGPGGVAVIVDALTDNKNRTTAEIRHILSKNGYGLATSGSALWAFQRVEGEWSPTVHIQITEDTATELLELVEELEENDDVQGVYTNAELDQNQGFKA